MRRGWTYRGTDFGSQVAVSDREKFRAYAQKSAIFLVQHAEVGSQDPHWYFQLADAYRAMAVDKDRFLAHINKGPDQFPDYDELYFVSSGYFSPKWFGSEEELEDFAQQAVARTEDTRGYEVYARIYWAAGRFSNAKYAFQSKSANWQHMVRGMNAILSRYPSQWNINHFAYFSCYRVEAQMLRYLRMIEEPIVESAWGSPVNYQKCRLNAGLSPSPNIAMPTR